MSESATLSSDQKRAKLVKELNYLFRNPNLTEEDRQKFADKLEKLVKELR